MRIAYRSPCFVLVMAVMALGCDSHGISSRGGSGGNGQVGGGPGAGGQIGSGGQAGNGAGGATTATGGATSMCNVDFPCSFAYRCTSAGYQPVRTNWDCHSVCGPGPCSGATCDSAGPEVACPAGTRCVGYGSNDVNQLCQPTDAGTPDAVSAADAPVEKLPSTDARPPAKYTDACQAVANSTFASVLMLECGLTPTGTASCHWGLSFTDNGATRQVSWRLSDYMQTLDYQCSGFTIAAYAGSGPDVLYRGTYDPATDVLTWDNYQYTRVVP